MTATPNAERLIAMLQDLGAMSYESPGVRATTKKVARLRLAGLQPVAIERELLTPNLWIDQRYMAAFAARGLPCERYEASRGRHSGLKQIREFNGADLVKVQVTDLTAAVNVVREIAGKRVPA